VLARDETGQQRNEGTVGPAKTRPTDLAPEHGQLVTKDEDLHILRNGVHPVNADQLEDAARQTVEERQGHDQPASLARLGRSNSVGE